MSNVKVNFDGSRDGQGRAGAGYFIRDHKWVLLVPGYINCGHDPILVAEARGKRGGIKVAIDIGLKNLRIEGDNISVINTLKQEWITLWEINNIIKDTTKDLELGNVVQITPILGKLIWWRIFWQKCLSREDWCNDFPPSLTNFCLRDL